MVGHYRFGIHKSELDNSDSCMSLFGSKWNSEDKITPHAATLEKKQKLDGRGQSGDRWNAKNEAFGWL